jgi:hypothetical protein
VNVHEAPRPSLCALTRAWTFKAWPTYSEPSQQRTMYTKKGPAARGSTT